ncbi:hypothetical protein, partial [uncultured Desulfovibrio sp.]|uniref:hypothetical protein n=1 Tax=uncultured Desulfovibrio sp. TaxID=167968 RepID=UPI00266F8E77
MAINGKNYDWEDIHVITLTGEQIGITEIKYSDEQSVTARYGRGAVPRGYGRGNYEASGSMVLDRDEWEKLKLALVALSNTGGIYDHKPFPIVVSYANDDMGTVIDTLRDCKISKFDGGGGSQGDDNVSPITCEFTILSPILWNGIPA